MSPVDIAIGGALAPVKRARSGPFESESLFAIRGLLLYLTETNSFIREVSRAEPPLDSPRFGRD